MAFTIAEAKAQIARLHKTSTKVREQAEKVMGVAIGTAETAGVAAGLAYMRGRYPSEVEKVDPVTKAKTKETTKDLLVAGIPLSLLVGLGGHVAGFTGMLGKYSEHGHAIGTGGLAEYAVSTLWKIGDDARVEANKGSAKVLPTPPKTAGAFASANRGQSQIGQNYPQPFAQTYGGHMANMF